MCLQLYNYSIVKKMIFLSVSLLLNHPTPLPAVPNYPVFLGVVFCFILFFLKSRVGQDWRQHHTFTKSGREEIYFPSDFTCWIF